MPGPAPPATLHSRSMAAERRRAPAPPRHAPRPTTTRRRAARPRAGPAGLDLAHHLVQLVAGGDPVGRKVGVRAGDVEAGDVGALACETQRRGPSDAAPARRAGDERDLPGDAPQCHAGRVTTRGPRPATAPRRESSGIRVPGGAGARWTGGRDPPCGTTRHAGSFGPPRPRHAPDRSPRPPVALARRSYTVKVPTFEVPAGRNRENLRVRPHPGEAGDRPRRDPHRQPHRRPG